MIHFDPVAHRYTDTKTGEVLPSVTHILKHNDVDGLMIWASRQAVESYGRSIREGMNRAEQKQYGMLVKDIKADAVIHANAYEQLRDEAADFGTMVHENLFQPIESDMPKPVQNSLRAFNNFRHDGNEITVLGNEEQIAVYGEGWTRPYAGTYDLLFEIDGMRVLADIKTSRYRDDAWAAQLGGYSFALEREGVQVDQLWIIHLDKYSLHGDYALHIADKPKAYRQWFAALELYYSTQETPYND